MILVAASAGSWADEKIVFVRELILIAICELGIDRQKHAREPLCVFRVGIGIEVPVSGDITRGSVPVEKVAV